jgi:DNA-binding transcriptional LysR family regulator
MVTMETRLDSELLRTFVAIVETGSFTRASEVVCRTQSAISMQIKRLEEIVGQALFMRKARGVSLTSAGETLLESAHRILKLLDKAEKSLNNKRIEGIVRVGIPEEYGSTVLPNVLAGFSENFSNVQVSVRCEQSENFPLYIDRGGLDLAVVVSDPGDEQGEILFHDQTVWATSKRHFTHEENPLPLAVFERGCLWRAWALKAMDQIARSYRIAYSSASVAGIQAAVLSGLAVAVLGQSTLPIGTRSLTRDEGFPRLPGVNITLQKRAGLQSEAVECMALAIVNAFQA